MSCNHLTVSVVNAYELKKFKLLETIDKKQQTSQLLKARLSITKPVKTSRILSVSFCKCSVNSWWQETSRHIRMLLQSWECMETLWSTSVHSLLSRNQVIISLQVILNIGKSSIILLGIKIMLKGLLKGSNLYLW